MKPGRNIVVHFGLSESKGNKCIKEPTLRLTLLNCDSNERSLFQKFQLQSKAIIIGDVTSCKNNRVKRIKPAWSFNERLASIF